ncbi:hypothetical protein T265_07508 [Opisthorchis viverrini]|uniref:Uncharacterized protein n=1 Tax=Opisthorchis viverrini TaxID=6198 RepID=A0A074ZCC0_OPIVI|nr:hypothetical protein T265_07508 [Opisthorchis viverrini]KER24946.1 hypothetical protein T265_07508 [Opisthorchis viverrini]
MALGYRRPVRAFGIAALTRLSDLAICYRFLEEHHKYVDDIFMLVSNGSKMEPATGGELQFKTIVSSGVHNLLPTTPWCVHAGQFVFSRKSARNMPIYYLRRSAIAQQLRSELAQQISTVKQHYAGSEHVDEAGQYERSNTSGSARNMPIYYLRRSAIAQQLRSELAQQISTVKQHYAGSEHVDKAGQYERCNTSGVWCCLSDFSNSTTRSLNVVEIAIHD